MLRPHAGHNDRWQEVRLQLGAPCASIAPCVHDTAELVRYQSRLCASQDRSEPFSFTLGQGQVIKVWAMS